MSFNRFKELFKRTFNDNINLFFSKEDWEYEDITSCPFEFQEIEKLDKVNYDSYGIEDTTLNRIYYIKDLGIYIEFWGRRSSYQGEEWYGYQEVIKKEKIITTWEENK